MGDFYKKLRDSLSTFWMATGVSVAVLDENGEVADYFGNPCEYCELIHQEEDLQDRCVKLHVEAGEQSAELGNCYFFVCHGNMVHFSIALVDKNKYVGSVLAGPILLEYPDAAALDAVIEQCKIPAGCRALFLSAMRDVLLVEPRRVYYLGELLYQLIYNILPTESNHQMQNRRRMELQQEMIGEAIHSVKRVNNLRNMQEKQEEELVLRIEEGDLEQAQVLLNDILGGIYFDSGNDLELIKLRMSELITVLSRRIIKKGISSDEVYDIVNEFQKKSANSEDLLEISFELGQVLRRFVEMIASTIHLDTSAIVHKGMEYIHKNYRNEITLEQTADYVAASPSHFSKVFKAEVGIGFAAYVNKLRLDKAKELLRDSSLPISDITQSVGYSNQQYFSRVFKNETGMTPGQYKKKSKNLLPVE
ncbi:MAG: PocR ligand-binding domain-containing protein [Eubacterium sp.]|nr:PocR ligand-binding domain-containing protein [Eubacterium sp.]